MKKIILTSVSIVGALSAHAALAENSWEGLYGGLSVGYQDARLKGEDLNLGYYGVTSPPNPGSAIGGTFAGYNFQLPDTHVISGVEVSYDIGGQTQSTSPNFRNIVGKSQVISETALKLKLGYPVQERYFPYVQFGAVLANTSYALSDEDGTYDGSRRTSIGWGAGVGLDYLICNNIFMRASYFYAQLPNESYITPQTYIPVLPQQHFDLNDFKIGIGYKF